MRIEQVEALASKLADMMESPQKWNKPWQTAIGAERPYNVTTGQPYQGFNSFLFAIEATEAGQAPAYATYKQFQSVGGQVRKGEKGTPGVKWGFTYRCEACGAKGGRPCPKHPQHVVGRPYASRFTVFRVGQQDGFEPEPRDYGTVPERHEAFDAWLASLPVNIRHVEQDRAFHRVGTDLVVLPLREQFATAEGYYSTAGHEVVHWTGQHTGRDQTGSFGSPEYAQEELVAEIGSAFLMAHHGLEPEPSEQHAAYLASWAKVLRDDPMALYRATRDAEKGLAHLRDLTSTQEATVAA